MRVLVWGIEPVIEVVEQKAEYLISTAKIHNVKVDFIGIGKTFTTFTNRLPILKEYLKEVDPTEVVLVMDGYDTLINNTVEYVEQIFKNKNTDILISAEKIYTYQWDFFKNKFDTIESEYRYVNAGTLMGYAGELLKMVDELFQIYEKHPTDIDQGLLGAWVYGNFENKKRVQLDTRCEVFWVTSKDWEFLKSNKEGKKEITNPYTGTRPFVIHNTGNGDSNLYKSYEITYNKIISDYE